MLFCVAWASAKLEVSANASDVSDTNFIISLPPIKGQELPIKPNCMSS
jgi:hypothetical protein